MPKPLVLKFSKRVKATKIPSARVAQHRKIVLSVLVSGFLLVAGLAAVIFSAAHSQDLRQQAMGTDYIACVGNQGCPLGMTCVSNKCTGGALQTPSPVETCIVDGDCLNGETCERGICEGKPSVLSSCLALCPVKNAGESGYCQCPNGCLENITAPGQSCHGVNPTKELPNCSTKCNAPEGAFCLCPLSCGNNRLIARGRKCSEPFEFPTSRPLPTPWCKPGSRCL